MTPQLATSRAVEEAALGAPAVRGPVVVPDSPLTELPLGPIAPIAIEERPSAPVIWREALHRRLLAGSDVIAAVAAVAFVLDVFGRHDIVLTAGTSGALVLLLFKVAGLYDRDDLRLVHSTLDEVPLLVQLSGLFALGIGILQSMVLDSALGADRIAALWLVTFGSIVVGRLAARGVAARASPAERCLVIGEAAVVDRIRHKLATSQARAVVIASLPLSCEDIEVGDWQAIPGIMRRVVADLNVHRIIIAPSTSDTAGIVELIRAAKAVGVRVSVLPRMFEVVGSAVEFDDVDGMTMLGVRRFGLARSSRLLKRAFDFCIAAAGLLIIGPLIAGIALAIRLESRGPIFFRQTRVGRDGHHFLILKFRSMVDGADAQKEQLRAHNEAGDGLFKITNDPRITRVGSFLRRTSLDELPQLFNVLRGEMSLVGPRPLVVDEDAQVLGLARSRLHLTPGMTGPWQIMGSRVPMQEMIGIDYLYVANWSLWLDLKLLVRTARHVSRRANL